jgi:hypothetical protein
MIFAELKPYFSRPLKYPLFFKKPGGDMGRL